MTKLNIGGGKNHPRIPGWTIVDLRDSADLVLDISLQPLPYEDGSVDVIFTSHTLEHILPQRLGFVLSEFKRVLAPGGTLRISVPDIRPACEAYLRGDRDFFLDAEVSIVDRSAPVCGLLAQWLYSVSALGNGHVHCFDAESLTWWLRKAGFADVRVSAFGTSAREELRGPGFDRLPRESLFVEALVPAAVAACAA
jgi:SAM-dependent methyltransferase